MALGKKPKEKPEEPLNIEDKTKPAEEVTDDEIKSTGQTIKEPTENPEEKDLPKEDEPKAEEGNYKETK